MIQSTTGGIAPAPRLTVAALLALGLADAASAATNEELEAKLGSVHTTIHIEPCKSACPDECAANCLSPQKQAAQQK